MRTGLFTDEALKAMSKSQKAGKAFEYKNMNKFKAKFIADFMKGKEASVEVVLSNSATPMLLNMLDLNPFGATPTWSWAEVQGMINGDKKVLTSVEAYLNDEALKYSFTDGSISSIMNTITDAVDMKLFKDNLHDEVIIVNIVYNGILLYSNNTIAG